MWEGEDKEERKEGRKEGAHRMLVVKGMRGGKETENSDLFMKENLDIADMTLGEVIVGLHTVLSPSRTTWQDSVAVSPECTVTVVLWRPRKAGRRATLTVVVGGGSEVAGGPSMLGANPPTAPTTGGKRKT